MHQAPGALLCSTAPQGHLLTLGLPLPCFTYAGVLIQSMPSTLWLLVQLKEHLVALGIPLQSCGEDSLPLRRALVAGLFPHAAKRQMDGEGWSWELRWWEERRCFAALAVLPSQIPPCPAHPPPLCCPHLPSSTRQL